MEIPLDLIFPAKTQVYCHEIPKLRNVWMQTKLCFTFHRSPEIKKVAINMKEKYKKMCQRIFLL